METQDTEDRRQGAGRRVVILLALLVAGVTMSSLHHLAFSTLSPVDELQHLDYLDRISHGEIVRVGDRVGQLAMSTQACRSIDADAHERIPCRPGHPYSPGDFQEMGYNTADIHPPLYYLLTSLPARGLTAVGLAPDLLVAGRVVGGLWLGTGLFVLWLLMEHLGVWRTQRVAVLTLVATTPAVVHASGTVNPDATALLAGALMALAVVRWEAGKLRTPWLIAPAAFAAALKATNALGIGAVSLYLIIRGVQARDRSERGRFVRAGILIVGVAVVVAIGWALIRAGLAREETNAQIATYQSSTLPVSVLLASLPRLITPVLTDYTPPFLAAVPFVDVASLLLHLALVATAFGGLFWWQERDRSVALALGGGLTLLTGGVILALSNYFLNSGVVVVIPHRYGLSVLGVLAAALALRLEARATRVVIFGIAALAAGSLAVALLRAI